MKPRWRIAGAAVGILSLAGCGGNAAPPAPANGANTTPPQTGDKVTITGDAAKGQQIFSQSCAGCHSTGSNQIVGPGLKGETAKNQLADGKPMNDQNLKDWIASGGSGKIGYMPGMAGRLSDQQINDVIAYLKTLK